jgi:hypothetical protein
MESDDGFRAFSHAIESDPIGVLLAKWRRDAFIEKLERLPDVAEVIPSGCLARGTHIGPVRDVDLIVVFDSLRHPDYGHGPQAAQAVMEHLQNELLGQPGLLGGQEQGLLRETELRAHVVRCRGGFLGPYADFIPSAPPVDVMPAVREGRHLKIPERRNGWIGVNPETFMRQIEQRQREWKYLIEVIRMAKNWAERNHLNMNGVAIEIMVLKNCPRPGIFETLSCGEAVARFFEKAAADDITSDKDPAYRGGKVDPDMKYMRLRAALQQAARLARQAMDAEHKLKNRYETEHPDEFWRQLSGGEYPLARERFWRAAASEPWEGPDREPVVRPPGPGDGARRPPGGESLWTAIFASTGAVSVPLTFG